MMNAVELTKKLIRMDTINPPGMEEACARFVGSLLEAAGFQTEYHSWSPKRASLVARIGKPSTKLPLCFTGHIDTVPLGAAPWNMDPFAGDTDGDQLFGRGSSDMKSGVAAFVLASINLAPTIMHSAGLELVITAGEETGCMGAFHLADTHGALGRAGAVVVAEPTSNYPFVGHKGAFWLDAVCRGVTAHGSMPEKGVNAVYRAARAITALEKYRFSTPPHALMGQASLNVGTIRGGLNINSVPDEATIGIDIRTVPTVDHAALYRELQNLLGADVELVTKMDLGPVYSDYRDEWIQQVFEVMQPYVEREIVPATATYFTDAAALNRAYSNPPTVILGPGEAQMAHQTNEYCVMEKIHQSVGAYEEIIRRWCV
jgi:succinyl-diaminopimelate desuccinylase